MTPKRSTVSCARWSGLSRSGPERREARGEVAELWRLLDDAVAAQLGRPLRDGQHDLDDIVDVALGVGAPRDRHADEIHRRGRFAPIRTATEHHRADLDTADPAGFVERDRERLPWIRER